MAKETSDAIDGLTEREMKALQNLMRRSKEKIKRIRKEMFSEDNAARKDPEKGTQDKDNE